MKNENKIAKIPQKVHCNAIAFQTDAQGVTNIVNLPSNLKLTKLNVALFVGTVLNILLASVDRCSRKGVKLLASSPIYMFFKGEDIEFNTASAHPTEHSSFTFSYNPEKEKNAASRSKFAKGIVELFESHLASIPQVDVTTLTESLDIIAKQAQDLRNMETEQRKAEKSNLADFAQCIEIIADEGAF